MIKHFLFWVSGWFPVGLITYRQMRRLAEDLTEWDEIADNRTKYPMTNLEDRRESVVYGNCVRTIEATMGRRRVLRWMAKYGKGRF